MPQEGLTILTHDQKVEAGMFSGSFVVAHENGLNFVDGRSSQPIPMGYYKLPHFFENLNDPTLLIQ